ncbi:type II and III secretion system protein, partial [bacterium]|nr:type II and III secretion system protein [bacterium]
YPNRIIFELEGGYLAEDVDEYLYTSRDGLVTKIDILFSPQHLAGVFQLIISCPDMGSYEVIENGSEFTITISGVTEVEELVEELVEDTPIEPASVDIEIEDSEEVVAESVEVLEEPEVIEEVPVVETAPAVEEITYGDTEPEPDILESPEPVPEEAANDDVADTQAMDEGPGFYEYPSVPIADEELEGGSYNFPEAEESFDPLHVSDAIVSLNVSGARFVDVMMILAEQAGVNYVLDAYWNISPTGFIREGFRPPGGPSGGGGGSGGFGGGGRFNPMDMGGGGDVTMHLSEVPFDTAFGLLMQSFNLKFQVFGYTEDTDPILFISSRERIEQELGLGTIQIYQLHYIDSGSAFNFLQTMDLMPSTSGYGIWEYGGGGSGGSGGGGYGGGGGSGYSANYPGAFMAPVGGVPAVDYGMYPNGYASIPTPQPMQGVGGGGSGGGGFGGGGSGGGGGSFGGGGGGGGGGQGQIATAKGGAIGVIATEETHDRIREALLQIDKPPKMIFVEATFITYDETNPDGRPIQYGLQNIGDWALEFGGDRFYTAFDTSGSEGLIFEILPKNQRMPFDDFRARFHYLFSDRNAKIIASPRVAVIDGFNATINVTENRPFIVDGGVVIDQFGNPIPAPDIVTFVPTGTTLSITPYIDDYGNVTMAMSPTNTSLLGEPTLVDGNLIFGTATANISTVLRMRDGETIILGGLKIKNRDYQTARLPLLGDIPLIGALFGKTIINITESQLIILMTVHMVGS